MLDSDPSAISLTHTHTPLPPYRPARLKRVHPEKGTVSFQRGCTLPDAHTLLLRQRSAPPMPRGMNGTSAKATPCSRRAERLLRAFPRGSWTGNSQGAAESLRPPLSWVMTAMMVIQPASTTQVPPGPSVDSSS